MRRVSRGLKVRFRDDGSKGIEVLNYGGVSARADRSCSTGNVDMTGEAVDMY